MRTWNGMIVAVLAVICMAGMARADAIAFDADPTATFGLNNWSGGYAFTLTSPVTIDKLLLFDDGGDGFTGIGLVNIYLDNGTTTLAAPTLTAAFFGTVQAIYADDTPPGGVWRQYDIIDTVLGPGSYTVIAGLTSDQDEVGYAPTTIDPALNSIFHVEQRSSNGNTSPLLNPTTQEQGFMTGSIYGPNFTVLVPTPAAALMALPIFAALMIARRRRAA